MAKSKRRRQKQLEKRKAKRASRHRELRREKSSGLRGELLAASNAPIRDCMIAEAIDDEGLGIVLISRDCRSEIAFASFLVDRYCLGVKNVHAQVVPCGAYQELIEQYEEQMAFDDVSPATARRLVEDAVAYARGLGFSPHRDYVNGREIFGDINPDLADEVFEMGKDGKPYYVAGPHESSQRSSEIINMLTRKCVPDGFHFIAPLAGPETFDDSGTIEISEDGVIRFLDQPHDD